MIDARDLVVRFGRTTALDAISFSVSRGAVLGLVGPNGSGKTTALRAVAGHVPISSGEVLVCGAPAGAPIARRALAVVPDTPGGVDELTVGELVALVRALYRANDGAAARAAALLDAFGLRSLEHVRLSVLSHGRRRQAAMVAALALGPRLLLLDEATAALDPLAVVVLRRELDALARAGGAVLLASQDLQFAESVCDDVMLLREGRAVVAGSLGALLEAFGASTLEEAYVAALVSGRWSERHGQDAV